MKNLRWHEWWVWDVHANHWQQTSMSEMEVEWPFACAIIADGGNAYELHLRLYTEHQSLVGTAVVQNGELPEHFDSGHKVPIAKRVAVDNLLAKFTLKAMLANWAPPTFENE